MRDELKELAREYMAAEPEGVVRLTAAGSNRIYWRIMTATGTGSIVGVEGTNIDENRAFINVCGHLRKQGMPAPELLAVSQSGMCYLLEDLGDCSLFELLESARRGGAYSSEQIQLLEKVMELLPQVQFKGGEGFDFSSCFPCESFDRRSIFWDLNYFKYSFLKVVGVEFNESLLEDDFESLAAVLLRDAPYNTFMYRDFQARNVMVKSGEPWLIDFQGGRRGPVEYDVASFLWQARAAYPSELKEHLIDIYMGSLSHYRKVNPASFRSYLNHFVIFRTLQVLGAYGFRGYLERKSHFVESIPAAIENLKELLLSGIGQADYPYLYKVLSEMAELDRFNPVTKSDDCRLTVRVLSFSYRNGIPQDNSGNGGGFVFDCRSMHNPGRYDEYKQLTGADASVIEYLEKQGEIQPFLEHVYGLVEPAVARYVERGFTSLMVAFGCTGGRHRSLYCANHLAAHLKEMFQNRIKVMLEHREHNIRQEL